jgi:hypothetical protein
MSFFRSLQSRVAPTAFTAEAVPVVPMSLYPPVMPFVGGFL